MQIWHLERLKEDKLAVTLQRWYNDASRKRSELQLQLQQLEEDEAGITNDVVCQPATSPMPTPVVSEPLTQTCVAQRCLFQVHTHLQQF